MTTEIIGIIIGVTIISVMVIGGVWKYREEKRLWNGGISAKNGKVWQRCFDTDSSGARGYTDGENYIWISFNVDI